MFGAPTCSDVSTACWKRIATSGPAPRNSHTLVYDSDRKRVLLFGGLNQTGTIFDDAWEWNGAAWLQLTPRAPKPQARFTHSMYYDSLRHRAVVYDGNLGYADLWELDNDPARKPAVIADFDLSSVALPGAALVTMSVSATAQARGFTTALVGDGSAVPGVALVAWNAPQSRWVPLASHTADIGAAPAASVLSANAVAPQDLLQSDAQVSVALMPLCGVGNAATVSTINLDYLELTATLRY